MKMLFLSTLKRLKFWGNESTQTAENIINPKQEDKYLKDNSMLIPLEEELEGRSLKRYYMIPVEALSMERYFVYQYGMNTLSMGMDNEHLMKHLTSIESTILGNDSIEDMRRKIIQLIHVIRANATTQIQTPILLNVASALFVEENENITSYNSEFSARKIQEWKSQGLEFFFVGRLLKLIKGYASYSESDLRQMEYQSQQNKETLLQVLDMLNKNLVE